MRRGLWLAVLLAAAAAAAGADPAFPLDPPDRSSPRATLATFSASLERAWVLYAAGSPEFREPFFVAIGCLDESAVPAGLADAVGANASLLLKEVIDRVPLPPASEIPDAEAVRAQGLVRWTIPRSEITLERAASGSRQGQFLFSAQTVLRAREFFLKVRGLPYQAGRPGAHYDELRLGGIAPVAARLAAALPSPARRELGGALVWQWTLVAVALGLALALSATAFRFGRRWSRWEEARRGGRRFGPLLFPLALLGLVLASRWVAWLFLRLAGPPYLVLRLALTALAHLAAAWLLAVVLARASEVLQRVFRTPEQPLNAQFVGLTTRVLTILAVAGYLFAAAQSLGLPVPALVAGLGVGGLAVALATQGTLENLIGGLILHADRPVRVGDVFKLGQRIGVVEEIGLRSTRIRTIERSLLAIPNADLVKREIENLTLQDRIGMRARVALRLETTPDQLRDLLASLTRLVREHPRLVRGKGGARLVGFGESSLDVDVRAFAATTDYFEFVAIREDVLLRVLELVEASGTRLAVPARLTLASEDRGLDRERTRAAEARARATAPKGE